MTARLAGYRDRVLARLERLPVVQLAAGPTPVEELPRLSAALDGPRLLVKRDDALSFAFGGNKVRKLALVAGEALALGADTLVTAGGFNRITRGSPPRRRRALVSTACSSSTAINPWRPTANALLDALCGATIRYVSSREERAGAIEEESTDSNAQDDDPTPFQSGPRRRSAPQRSSAPSASSWSSGSSPM